MGKHTIELNGKVILVTGSSGFIGSNLVIKLLNELSKGSIICVDSMNDYYDITLKEYRLGQIEGVNTTVNHIFIRGNIANKKFVEELFEKYSPEIVVNLAAQAGVRHSISHPDDYIEANIIGFYNILEACRNSKERFGNEVKHLVYASSSSVYGGNTKVPFSVDDPVDHPVSLYAATKKSNELMAHVYSKIYNIPSTGLRFFTVYGPAGRPDMFYYSATKNLVEGGKIKIYNYGNCKRDFTYIDDVVEGLFRVIKRAPTKEDMGNGIINAPYAVYNIGGGNPENLMVFIETLQAELLKVGLLPVDYDFGAHREFLGMQPGDVVETFADTSTLENDYGFVPRVTIREGLAKFVRWYKDYYVTK